MGAFTLDAAAGARFQKGRISLQLKRMRPVWERCLVAGAANFGDPMLRRSKDDQIRPSTRIVAAVIVPILVQAFTILFFMPEQSGIRFAWPIQSPMTAAYMGAGYLGGAWLFANVVFRRRWHRVASGFWSVTAFTWAMLLATVLHWDRFDPTHPPFQLWLDLYILTPLLVPFVWSLNRSADTGVPEPGDPVVPATVRRVL